MNTRIIAIALTLLCNATAVQAQTAFCCITSTNIIGSSSISLSNCDTNERTASEISQCKLEYWRKREAETTKDLDVAQKRLDEARDRVRAFTREGAKP